MESETESRESYGWEKAFAAASRTQAPSAIFLTEVVVKESMFRIYNSSGTRDQVTDERVPSVPIQIGRVGFML